MAGVINTHVQPLILTVAGAKPTVPNPTTLTPSDTGWIKDSDILEGEYAINTTDGIEFRRINDAIQERAYAHTLSYLRNGFSVITRGITTFDRDTGLLSCSNTTFITSKTGELYTLEGGTGVGSGLITAFSVHPGAGGVYIFYVDIPSTSGTVELKKALFTDVLFHSEPAAGIERLIIGSGYYSAPYYLLDFMHLKESNNERKIDANSVLIQANTDKFDEFDATFKTTNGNDITMLNPNNWVKGIQSVVFSFDTDTTIAGAMYVDWGTGGNNQIKLSDKIVSGVRYDVSIKAKLISGTSMPVRIGAFVTNISNNNAFDITPTSTLTEYTGYFIGDATNKDMSLGAIAASNTGSNMQFDDFKVVTYSEIDTQQNTRLTNLENTEYDATKIFASQTDVAFQSLSKNEKVLTKVCVLGDSLMGNDIGGAIPGGEDEGATLRPIRLDINNIPRRIYDDIKFNAASHFRLDNAAWTKSGTWTSFNDTTVWEPIHSATAYHKSTTSSAYVEISVPDGQENFAFIAQKNANGGVLNITLNAGSIAAYGNSTVDLYRANTGAGDIGNAYWTEVYTGLPTGGGANVIRIAKEANTEEVRVWGGLYWSGNTIIVHNVAHGGHDLESLTNEHMTAEVIENNFDAIIFQLPIMNDTTQGTTLTDAVADLEEIIDNKLPGKDLFIMTCNPFGDNGSGTNYYADNLNPSMEDFTDVFRPVLLNRGIPFVDVFRFFKYKIENRGGTLLGGEGGLYYTDDGQHPNATGCTEWFNLIKYIFANKPIKY
jgi:hypothetical protein